VQAANRQTTKQQTKQHAQPTVLSVAEKKARAKKIWEDLILDEKVKDELIELALHFDSGSLAASKGLLLYGPPGTGKTLIARKLSETMGAEFFPVTVAELKGPWIGQTAERTKAIWEKALAAPKAVLFVDECEGVFGARGGAGVDSFVEELVQTFIAQWDGFSKQRNVWVVGATNLRDKIDAAVLSRFGEEVQIPLPGSRERVKIFQQELAKKGIRGPLPAETEELTQGFSGRDLENIAGRIARKCEAAGGVTLEILEAVTRNKRAQGSTASDGNATWDRLVLPEQTLQTLKNTAELFKHAEEFEKINISMPRGILLYGPPGTGKTQIARTLAKESGLQFIAATTGDLKANYIGQSANKVKMLFERARGCAPCILFIDELDIVAPGRGSRNNDSFTQEIVGQLLQELDGVKSVAGQIFLLGATNLLESIDSAIRSRFPTHIEIPPPDEDGIAALLRVFLGKKPIDFDLEPASRIMAKGMAGFSGRDIRSIVERAEQAAVGRAIKAGKPQSAKITLVDLRAALPAA
jgi:transitional endoplasmic reticulum ATPase